MSSKNVIANAVSVIGIIEMIGGLIAFIVILTLSEGEAAGLSAIVLVGGIVSGIAFLGFGEIIGLLADISSALNTRQTTNIPDALPRL